MSIDAVRNYSIGLQQTPKASLKSQQSFTSNSEVDEEKSNATKYMIGATALAAVIGLGVAGYKGKLGKSVQKFLGGAEKAVEKGTQNASENAGSVSKPLTSGTESVGSKASDALVDGAEEAVNKCNEYFKSQGLDNVAFIPKNDPDKVIVIEKSKDYFAKYVYNKNDFKTWEDRDKAIYSAVLNNYSRRSVLNKRFSNNSTIRIERERTMDGENKIIQVSSVLNSSDGDWLGRSTLYDVAENGRKINPDIDECVKVRGKSRQRSSDKDITEAKKEFLAKFREGLNWSDEPIRKTPQA